MFSLCGPAAVLAAVPFLRSTAALIGANALLWFVVAAAGPVSTLLVVAGAVVAAGASLVVSTSGTGVPS